MTPRPSRTAKPAVLATALCALFLPGIAHAQAPGTLAVTSVTPTKTGALYNYSYTLNYTSPDGGVTDLAYVESQTLPNAALTNFSASPGFFTDYDSSLGFITFLETDGSKTFAANSPVSFSFSSPFAPITRNYDGTDGVTTFTGRLIAPSPEPNALVSLGAGALGLALLAARRRAAVRTF